jgi:formate-nitrite transporter family protein
VAQKQHLIEETGRLTADEIFDSAYASGREELDRSSKALVFSGLIAGLIIGLSPLATALTESFLGQSFWASFIAKLLYPIGLVTVIIGRSQLFTENTLYPIAVVLKDRAELVNTLRLWGTVFVANIAGALAFAALFEATTAISPKASTALIAIGEQAVQGSSKHLFWAAVVAGWLLALIAWLVEASHWTTGQVAVVWILALLLGLGEFAHCIVGSTEILTAVLYGSVALAHYLRWLLWATLGNVIGGTVLVAGLNYGQLSPHKKGV